MPKPGPERYNSYHFDCINTRIDYSISVFMSLEVVMRKIQISDTLPASELKRRMLSSKDIREHNRWQALYLAKAKGLRAREIADMTGVSIYTRPLHAKVDIK